VRYFAFLTDISDHLNFLNLKLQEHGKLIFQLLNDITAFEIKLKLFIKQIGEGNFSHFNVCYELKKNYCVSTNAEFHEFF